MTGSYCNNCGRRNSVTAVVCPTCEVVLSPAVDPPTEQTRLVRRAGDSLNAYRVETYSRGISLPPGGAALVVTRGPNEGSRYILKEDTLTIGRDAASSIMLDDITVSRRHAEVRHRGKAHSVVDCRSLNGTYLNGEQVDEAKLTHGDTLQIGVFKLLYITQGAS